MGVLGAIGGVALGLAVALAGPGAAQQAAPRVGLAPLEAPPEDAVLQRYVAAAQAANAERGRWAARVQAASSDAEAEAVARAALVAIQAAIEAAGMEVLLYRRIHEAAKTDAALAARIAAIAGG